MDVLVERCAGLDVHRDTVVATVRRPGPGGARRSQTRTFSTMTSALEELADWLVSEKVTLAGMESTGVYWKPVYYVLEERFPVWVINAEHLRNVPGRKIDVADSVWIAQLIEHGLVSPSFVPPRHIRLLRDLTRHGRRLTEERTRTIQRLEKVLQDAGIKFTSVASTILGKTGRAILGALLAGQDDPAVLAELAKGRLRPKIPALRQALAHRFRLEHHGLLITQMLAHVDFLEASIAETSQQVDVLLRSHTSNVGGRAHDENRSPGT
jgi:transposase